MKLERLSRRSLLAAAAAAAALTVSTPALAGKPGSGGPGGLGTEVPFDSRVARQYFNYNLPTDTPEALRIRDAVQKLHADHQAAVSLGQLGGAAQDPAVRGLAQRVASEQTIIDGSLVDVAKDSLLSLAGPAYDAEAQATAATVRELQAAAGPERDSRLVASLQKLIEGQLASVEELQPQARKALRQQLGSILTRERKLLQGELDAVHGLASKVSMDQPSRG